MDEWNSAQPYATRVTNIRDGSGGYAGPQLNTSTVFDDGAVDTLLGGGDLDWFLVGLGDLTDEEAGEILTPL